jgi:MotA/TolQ/ExbB proton channel family protein
MLARFDPVVLDAVGRASKRSSSVVHEDMKAGLYDLATIASIAPWFGIFGTIAGIVNSFQGISGEARSNIWAICNSLSRAMWFTAFGLLVGLVALWSYEYLAARLRSLDLEMESASQELLNQLSRFPGRFEIGPATGQRGDVPMLGELPIEDVQRDEKYFHRCYFLAGVTLVLAWFVQVSRDSLPAACFYVPITLAICCVFVYPFWSKFLYRRPGALVAMASTLCLCWSVAELVLGRHLP